MNRITRVLSTLALALVAGVVHAQAYSKFQPANGVLKGSTSTYVTTAATSADILALWSGSCSSSTFLRGDGACATAGGGGGGSPGGADTNVQYNASGSFAADANFIWDYTAQTMTLTGKGAGFNNAFIVTGPVNPAFELNDTAAGAPWLFSSTAGVFKIGILNGGGSYGGVALQVTGNVGSRNITDVTLQASGSRALGITSAGEVNVNGSVGSSGNCLTSAGASAAAAWASCGGGGGSPGGANTNVQFNNSGAFGGTSRLTWNDSTSRLALTNASTGPGIIFNDPTGFQFIVATDGGTGAVVFTQTVAGTYHPLSVLPTGGINIVGGLGLNSVFGQAGQVMYSPGGGSANTPTWAEVKMLAKIANTETTVSSQSVGSQYCVAAPATVSFASTTTFADDTDLIFDNVNAGAYKFEVQADWLFTNATGGVKVQMGKTATAVGPIYSGVGMCNNVAQTAATGTTNSTGFTCTGATGTEAALNITGTFTVTLAGSVSVQWAQNQSDASATVRQGGATFCITRLN